MFDIGWSELMILGIIALIVVGPKELPVLLRTLGKYAGVLKRQASEFRSHFDQALREAELDQFKDEITGLKSEMEGAVRDAARVAEKEVSSARRAIDEPVDKAASATTGTVQKQDGDIDPDYHDADGLPLDPPRVAPSGPNAPTGEQTRPADAPKSGAA